MKKIKRTTFVVSIIIVLFFSIISVKAQSTAVGIGTNSPQEELDVQGDINVTGSIKTNMQSGSEGQILQMQSGGAMSWVDLCEFKNFKTFIDPQSTASWTVPSGVTKIAVELWGGGGAGSTHGGGGSGGYCYGVTAVTPGTSIQVIVGDGGSNSVNATDSKVIVGFSYIQANGGSNASGTGPGSGVYGGGALASNWSWKNLSGCDGFPVITRFDQMASSTFSEHTEYGNGADSPLRPNTGGRGATYTRNTSTNAVISLTHAYSGKQPGGGGGGSYYTTYGGGDGQVIIYW